MRDSTRLFRHLAPLLLLTPMHTVACVAGDGGLETREGSIVQGSPDSSHSEVGTATVGARVCSATLVAPRVAVSAKHCIEPYTAPRDVYLRFGDQGVVATGLFYEGPFSTDGKTPPADFLAMSLDRDVSGITPASPRRQGLDASFVGRSVLIVGWGRVSAAADAATGARRSGWTTVQSLSDDAFQTRPSTDAPATTCQGDSGGAVFDGGELVGVISGTFGECDSGLQARVDRHIGLVDQALARARRGGSEPDSCRWAYDGVCDVPTYCEPGTDSTDCANGCTWARDGACDEPWICARGSDTADCAPSRERCRWAHDGECDEPLLCEPGTDEGDCPAS